jgi:hypothetical protein
MFDVFIIIRNIHGIVELYVLGLELRLEHFKSL